jgi:ABC-type Mn2+/Zn2+ transport system permease subunit
MTAAQVTVLTDDERPFVIYGEATMRMQAASKGRSMSSLLEPFSYGYMVNAMWASALVGAICAFLSAYLMLKGWSLIGDALSHCHRAGRSRCLHAGPAVSHRARFLAGGLAAAAMLFLASARGCARMPSSA